MAKDAKAKADEATKDGRDDRIAELELALEAAKAKADEAVVAADQARRDMLAAQCEVVAMVDAGARRPEATEPKRIRMRLRDSRIVGLNIRGTAMDGEFRDVDVTGCTAKQIDDLVADPLLEVEPA